MAPFDLVSTALHNGFQNGTLKNSPKSVTSGRAGGLILWTAQSGIIKKLSDHLKVVKRYETVLID